MKTLDILKSLREEFKSGIVCGDTVESLLDMYEDNTVIGYRNENMVEMIDKHLEGWFRQDFNLIIKEIDLTIKNHSLQD